MNLQDIVSIYYAKGTPLVILGKKYIFILLVRLRLHNSQWKWETMCKISKYVPPLFIGIE